MRRFYKGIARDEMKHAQLSWDLHAWFMSELLVEERSQVRTAQRKAISQLRSSAVERFSRMPFVLGLQNVQDRVVIVERFLKMMT